MSGLSTTSTDVKDSRQKIAALKERHEPTFKRLGITDPLFIPKLAYRPKTEAGIQLEGLHLAFFTSEISKGKDIYIEFAGSPEYEPQDPERRLFKWRFNPHWETEYAKTERHNISGYRYLVPVEELIEIKEEAAVDQTVSKDFELPDPDADLPLSQITIRDFYAVFHNKPVSQKKWLNDIINSNDKK